MSCPFKQLYSNKQSTSTEDTITGWGCQVIKDGGLNFYIKTDKFLECEYHEDDEETASVCPFRFHSSNSEHSKKIDINEIKKEIQQNKEKQEQKKREFEQMKQKMNELDQEGHFTIPLLNMPPFLTFRETKEILSSMEMKLKDQSITWDQLQFYIKNNNNKNIDNNNIDNNNIDNKFILINDNNQLNEIIKNDINILYLK